jgi:serine/threonine protein kinase
MYKDIKYISPIYFDIEDSRSMSLILRVRTNKHQKKNHSSYVLKISYPITQKGSKKDNSFLIEREIYKKCTDKLILNNNTPNIAAYYYSVLAKRNLYKKLPSYCRDLYMKFAYSMLLNTDDSKKNDIFDYNLLHIMAIEDLKGKDLTEWLPYASYNDIKNIIFQVIYTLECMNYIGIRHNDLHDKNVFIVKNNNPEYLYYVIDYNEESDEIECFKIKSKNGIAKIYDFDNGSIVKEDKLKNSKLEYFNLSKYGMTNSYNSKFDSFTFFGYLLHEFISQTMEYQDILEIKTGFLSLPFEVIKMTIEKINNLNFVKELSPLMEDLILAIKVQNLIKSIIPDWNLMNAEWRLPYRMGKVKKLGYYDINKQNDEQPDLLLDDEQMRTNMQILKSKHFSNWKLKDNLNNIQKEHIYILPSLDKFKEKILFKLIN